MPCPYWERLRAQERRREDSEVSESARRVGRWRRRHFHWPPSSGPLLLEGGLVGTEEPVIEDDVAGEPFGGEEGAAEGTHERGWEAAADSS